MIVSRTSDEQKQVDFLFNNHSYRLDIDNELKTITFYEVFENKDDFEIFKYVSK